MKGQAHVNRDGTPSSTQKLSSRSPASGWKAELRRLAIASVYVFLAIVAIGTLLSAVLSHFGTGAVLQALLVFLGWPLGQQVSTIGGTALLVGFVAAGKQLYQRYRTHQAQATAEKGAGAAIRRIVLAPIEAIQKLLTHIEEQLETLIKNIPPNRSETPPPTPPPPNLPLDDSSQPHETAHPIPSSYFIGREIELGWLVTQLISHSHENDTTVVYGIPGIGKSALVQKALDQVGQSRFNGAVISINCGDKSDHIMVIRATLEYLDPNRQFPAAADIDVLRQMSEHMLSDQERLIILDAVEPVVRLEDLVRGLRTSQRMAHMLIVTTATPSVDVAPIEHQLELKALGTARAPDGETIDEALEMFARYAGKTSAKDFGDDIIHAKQIVQSFDRHTYAIKLMGNYVRLQPNMLNAIAKDVAQLSQGKVSPGLEGVLKPVFMALETVVTDLNLDSRRLLYAFVAAFRSVDAGRLATRALGAALELRNVDGAIFDLLNHRLMESKDDVKIPRGDRHRLQIHTLLLGYVSNVLERPEWEALCVSACDAAATFYARYSSGYDVSDPARKVQMILERDADNITRSLIWAIDHQQNANVVAIARGMRRYWHDRWLTETAEQLMPKAIDSATALVNAAKQAKDAEDVKRQRGYAAELSFTLGRVYRRKGKFDEAEKLFQNDLAYRLQRQQHSELAQVYHQFAQLERSRGNMSKGLLYCRKGLAVVEQYLPQASPEDSEEAKKLLQAKGLLIAQEGRIQRSRGNLTAANQLFSEALELFKKTGDLLEQGVALGYLGRIARVLGELDNAKEYFERSYDLAVQVHDSRGMGVVETQFGRIARTQGYLGRAKEAFQAGLKFAKRVEDKQAEAVNLNYLGRIAQTEGDTSEARRYFTEALAIATQSGDRLNQGVNLHYLGRVARKEGMYKEAHRHFSRSLVIHRAVEDHRGYALVLAELAQLDIDRKKLTVARWRLWRSLRRIRQVGDKRSEGTILRYYGDLEFEAGNINAAEARFTMALNRAQALGDAGGEVEAQKGLDRVTAKRSNIV